MTRHSTAHVLSLCLAAFALGCDEGKEEPLADYASAPPLTLDDGLFYAASAERALVVDLSADEPRTTEHALPVGDARRYERPGTGAREVVVLTSGRDAYKEGDTRHPAVPSHVLVYARDGERLRLPLQGRYGELSLSDDGKYAVAFRALGSLTLQNAVEVIDLARALDGEAGASQVVDLSLDGRAPTRIVFSPATFARRLALAPLDNALQVIDLEHPERREISITLSEQRSLAPGEILFTDRQIFVQSAGDQRVISFQLVELPRGQHSFQLAPSVLTASGPVSDIALTGAGETLRVLALGTRLDVLDPVVGNHVALDASGFPQLEQFIGRSPVDEQQAPRAMLYGRGRSDVGFVDLGASGAWPNRRVERVALSEPIAELLPVPERKLAVGTHASGRMSLIDLEDRTVKVVLLDGPAHGLLVDTAGTPARLWVETTQRTLGIVDLATFVPTMLPVTLGEPLGTSELRRASAAPGLGNLLLVPGAQRRRVAVLQASASGHVTLLDAADPQPATARELVGIFLSGLFD